MFGLTTTRRYNKLQKKHDELELKLKDYYLAKGENSLLQSKIRDLENQFAEVKKQIREQNEADLFFVSAKIQKKLLDGEPKENVQDLRLAQMAYQHQLELMQQPPYPNSFLQGLGLGGLFGKGLFK